MAERSGFFNSVNGDRIYKAEDFAEYFNSLITNGIFPNPSTNLQVIANNDMTVTLKAGKAWINGYIYINDSDKTMNIDVADGVLNRIDRVVIQFDKTNREIKAVVKKGQFTTNPIAPEIIRNADYYELGIADIYIGKGITSINQSNITDLRLDNTYCGLVNSLIQADVTTLYNQYSQGFEIKRQEFEQAFNSWFTNIQNILDENTAGNLLNLINEKAQASHTHTKANITDFTHTHSINEITNLFNTFYAGTTTNSGNNYSVTVSGITSYQEGLCIAVKINADSTGASTISINGLGAKAIKKANGTDVTNLKANGIYTMRYNGTNFILQGEGASGNATASDLLSGKTATTDAGEITGTMPNKVGSGTIITPGTSDIAIPQGYYGGALEDGKVKGDANLVASNIKSGVSIYGITGTYLSALTTGSDLSSINNILKQTSTSNYVKTKSAIINKGGSVRVSFQASSSYGSSGCKARIYKNGIAVGIERALSYTSTPPTYTEDITVNAGDEIAVYLNANGYEAYCHMLNISFNLSETFVTFTS